MQEKSDVQLLREYAAQGDDATFREIVVRHTDLVYSSALRQVASPDLACDVAQSVFTDLARKGPSLAKSLDENASILGWLFRSTRFTALNQLRDDRRRQARERQAMEQLDPAPETTPEWDRVRPVLDEAIAELDDDEREAVLLRFFKNRDFRAVGQALGVSDDAAQKRVSRALDKLRELLSRRGITTSAAALSIVLSANAVQAAPVGLAVTISTAAALGGTTIAATATATATKAIAMTTMQKAIIGATLSFAVGAGVYEATQASNLRTEMQTLQRQQAALTSQIPQLQRERDEARSRLASLGVNEGSSEDSRALLRLRGEVGMLRRQAQEWAQLKAASRTNHAAEAELQAWVDRVKRLQEHSTANPNLQIPEFQLLTEQDWLDVVRDLGKPHIKPDPDFRRSMASLRRAAEEAFAPMMRGALDKYLAAHNGVFPTDVARLKPYFELAVDDAILQRYTIVPRDWPPFKDWAWDNLGKKNQVITQKALIDEEYESHIGITRGFWSYGRRIVGGNPKP